MISRENGYFWALRSCGWEVRSLPPKWNFTFVDTWFLEVKELNSKNASSATFLGAGVKLNRRWFHQRSPAQACSDGRSILGLGPEKTHACTIHVPSIVDRFISAVERELYGEKKNPEVPVWSGQNLSTPKRNQKVVFTICSSVFWQFISKRSLVLLLFALWLLKSHCGCFTLIIHSQIWCTFDYTAGSEDRSLFWTDRPGSCILLSGTTWVLLPCSTGNVVFVRFWADLTVLLRRERVEPAATPKVCKILQAGFVRNILGFQVIYHNYGENHL